MITLMPCLKEAGRMENLSNIGVIKGLISEHGFTFSKRLGQNFLVNPTVCPRIASLGGAKKGVGVLEIGPGIGVLTNELAKLADRVVAVEIDKRLIPILERTLSEHSNVKIINEDILELDLDSVIREEFSGLEVVVCANLPYYITSPIIMTLLQKRLPIKRITAMVQREAGIRLTAPLGSRDSGAVTVAVNYFSEARILFDVSRGSFVPSPRVDSCVVSFEPRSETPPVKNEDFFFKVVKFMFSQRRKTLLNSITQTMGFPKEMVKTAIFSFTDDLSIRPETLRLNDIIVFSDTLYELFMEALED